MVAAAKPSVVVRLAQLALVLLCIGLLGWLTTRHLPASPVRVGGFVFGFLLLPALGLAILSSLLSTLNPAAANTHGKLAGLSAVSSGMLLIVPFTLLALIADLVLGWSAVLTFATAGVMTGAGAVGTEMSKLGSRRPANMILPTLVGILFVVGWMLLGALLQAVNRG
jgi:hypothetical protein